MIAKVIMIIIITTIITAKHSFKKRNKLNTSHRPTRVKGIAMGLGEDVWLS